MILPFAVDSLIKQYSPPAPKPVSSVVLKAAPIDPETLLHPPIPKDMYLSYLKKQRDDKEAARLAEIARLKAIEDARIAEEQQKQQEATPPQQTIVEAPVSSGEVNCGDNQYAQFIYQHESGCRLDANNGSCVGIGQACPSSKLYAVCPDLNYSCQNAFFTNYAQSRYGSWEQAYGFWLQHSYW